MKIGKQKIGGDQHPPPNGRLAALQHDLDLKHLPLTAGEFRLHLGPARQPGSLLMLPGLGVPIAELGFGGRGVEKHGVGLGWVLGVMGLLGRMSVGARGKKGDLRLGFRVRVQVVEMGFVDIDSGLCS